MKITLSWHEASVAAAAGVRRQLEALRLGRSDNHSYEGDGWSVHIEGAAAEMAFAKAIDRYWTPVASDPHSLPGDVSDWQVRSTPRADGSLILHESDPSTANFVLMTGRVPTFELVGWVPCSAYRRPEFWRSEVRHPAYFVPQSVLRQFTEREGVHGAAA